MATMEEEYICPSTGMKDNVYCFHNFSIILIPINVSIPMDTSHFILNARVIRQWVAQVCLAMSSSH